MDFVIVTGLSGAGKSKTADALEDMGYYCIDNIPPELIIKFADICSKSDNGLSKVACVSDIRGGEMFSGLIDTLEQMKSKGYKYKLLFLDCCDEALVRRYKETRRKHPLTDIEQASVEDAIAIERVMLQKVKSAADYILDTSILTTGQLKERVTQLFNNIPQEGIIVSCMSFGFKFGLPAEADLVFDVRCLPNPFYVAELKPKTGLEQDVKNYIFKSEKSNIFLNKITELIDYALPLYIAEGKSQLVVAMGCTGGKHRSVAFAEALCRHLSENGYQSVANHRDF